MAIIPFRQIVPALLLLCFPLLCACRSGSRDGTEKFPEQFEQGVKNAYASAVVALHSGSWQLDDALIGRTPEDRRNGAASLRLKPGGTATTLFNIPAKGAAVMFEIAMYGRDRASQLSLWSSADNGASWTRIGTPVAASGASLSTITIPVPEDGPVRLRLRNEGPGRVNLDDFRVLPRVGVIVKDKEEPVQVNAPEQHSERDDNMALGNPSGASVDPAARDNFLIRHPQFDLSYNDSKGIANWVSWHLSNAWRGDAARCNCFFSDTDLPEGYFRATTSNYTGTGFDRGHLCPSEDRTGSPADNAATFLMSNIAPQAPQLNQKPWVRLEEYARRLCDEGQELYIIAGNYGSGGSGMKGAATSISGGRIGVPARFWKIIVVLPAGANDLQRITKDTRVIAVDMPNMQSVSEHDWGRYRTSVLHIEQQTGYRFLDKVPAGIAAALKARVDDGPVE